MEEKNNPIYEHNTLEFVTVALEFCTFVENAGKNGLLNFLDKAVKILPLLYLKATPSTPSARKRRCRTRIDCHGRNV